LVHFLTPAGKNVDDLARVVLEQLGYRVEVGRSERNTATVEGSLQTFLAPLTARIMGRVEQSTEAQSELMVTTPTDQGLLNVMADSQLVLAIDEMHKASDGFRIQLAEMIKAVSNLGRQYPRIVILGTTADATELVRRDE